MMSLHGRMKEALLIDKSWINIFIYKFNDEMKSVIKTVSAVQWTAVMRCRIFNLHCRRVPGSSTACTRRQYQENQFLVSMNKRMDYLDDSSGILIIFYLMG